MKKSKKQMWLVAAVLVIAIGAFAYFQFAIPSIVGAYDPSMWEVSYDPDCSTDECKNLDPEFEVVTEQYTVGGTQSRTPVKTICGNYFSPSTTNYTDLVYFNTDHNPSWCSLRMQFAINTPYVDIKGVASQLIADADYNYQCKLPSVVQVPISMGISYGTGTQASAVVVPINMPSPFYKFVASGQTFQISYTVPREEIPSELHYRKYSCPLPTSYQLVSDTFFEGEEITLDSFSYTPAFFCERHPAIMVVTAIAASGTNTQVYKDIVSGVSITVSSGEKWTLIYATRDTVSKAEAEMGIRIGELEANLQDQLDTIAELEATVGEKAELLAQLDMTISEQAMAIDQLTQLRNEQAIYIEEITTNVAEQAQLINELELNLQEKAELVDMLTVTNEEQARLIAEMKLSFAEQGEIIDALGQVVEEDAVIITTLTSKADEQGQIIANMQLNIDEQATLITKLTTSVEEQGKIIAELRLTTEQQAELIKQLTTSLDKQAVIISEMELSEYAKSQLINELTEGDEVLEEELTQKVEVAEAGRELPIVDMLIEGLPFVVVGVIALSIVVVVAFSKKKRRRRR